MFGAPATESTPGLNDLSSKPRDRGLVIADAEPAGLEDDEPATKAERPTYPCESCGGTGRYRGVRVHQAETRCFACGGRGYFFASYKDRMDKRQKAKTRKAEKAAAAVADYTSAHPEAIAWLKAKAEARPLRLRRLRVGRVPEVWPPYRWPACGRGEVPGGRCRAGQGPRRGSRGRVRER